jgi:ABC-type multidrug transport system fused ATPase/permease subunit
MLQGRGQSVSRAAVVPSQLRPSTFCVGANGLRRRRPIHRAPARQEWRESGHSAADDRLAGAPAVASVDRYRKGASLAVPIMHDGGVHSIPPRAKAFGRKVVFSDLTLDLLRGETITILGASGSGKSPSDLSGGMKKRVGLARTLALQPDVILYDEPTSGLDPINTARINHLIKSIQRRLELTSVVVTHDMGTAFAVSDRLAMIGHGRVLFVGSKEEFKNTDNDAVRNFIEGRAPETEDVAALISPP